ncbi:hypothetical protein [Limosilactobacillus vaginalis]|uniref:hypothetical protein n=1 Tax=Limosilactobacillus vaginalis TaxID=1633 RepID=UPI0025A3D197|nr:hypothetical protein [Limosilactobacillus vaginalis]MDM8304297.1 hypothetical protein [Limosilactobacillus vaginalis]
MVNDNLLAVAKIIFEETYLKPTNYFSHIPPEWEKTILSKVTDFINGYNFKSKDMLKSPQSNTYKVFKQGNIKVGGGLNENGTKSWILKNKVQDENKFILKKWDLLMAMTDMKNKVAILGNTALMNIDDEYVLNQRVGLLRANHYKSISPAYLYLLTNSSPVLDEIRKHAHSGVQVNLSSKEIKNTDVVIAPEKINRNFNSKIKPLFYKLMQVEQENDKLYHLKKLLLDKYF